MSKLTTDGHKASCGFSATAELLGYLFFKTLHKVDKIQINTAYVYLVKHRIYYNFWHLGGMAPLPPPKSTYDFTYFKPS